MNDKAHTPPLTDGELQTHRLTNVGALSAGVAHDLNNLFSGALTFSTLLRNKLTDPDQLSYVHLIEKTLHRATSLSNGVLEFLAEHTSDPQPVSPLNTVRDTVYMVQRTLNKSINISVSLPSKSFPILAKRTDLMQLTLNLLINARDAVGDEGEITVTGKYRPRDNPDHFILKVSDNGVGIPDKDLQKIFDPFYSTKEKDEGSGLGLTIVQQMANQMGGKIQASSTEGSGTEFTVTIPVFQKRGRPQPAPSLTSRPETS
jgi:two-component system cell cycle sensor histidine kinase/response regulator CckA